MNRGKIAHSCEGVFIKQAAAQSFLFHTDDDKIAIAI
jgi:hypothetical protein